MKSFFLIILLSLTFWSHGQSSDSFTSQESDENENTTNNTTKLNLFNIDFDGGKIPITLTYKHTGIKVNDIPGMLGYGWDIENMGIIKRIVNDKPDNLQTWLNTPNPDFSSSYTIDNCDLNLAPHMGDYSPDFFSCKTSSGLNFDFLYKKNYPQASTPVLLSNDFGIRIDTNFNTFIGNNSQENSDLVFTIYNNAGTKYKFINGPILHDMNRNSSAQVRNDFYLESIENPNKTETVTIKYIPNSIQTEKRYYSGYTGVGSNNGYDYDNLISTITNGDYYFVDDTKLLVEQISTSTMRVNFYYTSQKYLDEIIISDLNGNKVGGYKFEYDNEFQRDRNLLSRVYKYDVSLNQSLIYEFSYFSDSTGLESSDIKNSYGHYEDYFGYNNGVYKDNPMPFKKRGDHDEIIPAGDFYPNLSYAKVYSLSQIKNKFGGITSFDYQLNSAINQDDPGFIYGGGIVIKSIEKTSYDSKRKLTIYDYSDLRGYAIAEFDIARYNMPVNIPTSLYFSKILNLMYQGDGHHSIVFELNDIHRIGNFFGQITEISYDENDQEILRTVKTFKDNYTGLYKAPLLVNEKKYNQGNNLINETQFTYEYLTIENIDRAVLRTESRSMPGGSTRCVAIKSHWPIPINRVKLKNKKTIYYYNNQLASSVESNYEYVNDNSSLIRRISETTSDNSSIQKVFYYIKDNELANAPKKSHLIAQNIVGVPMITETYKGGEKLSEDKIEYGDDTSAEYYLLPKFVYSKKGSDTYTSLEKKITYNRYDDKGNLVEYNPEFGINTCVIWGYNQTQPVAKLENINYNDIPQTLIDGIHNADESTMASALDNLRNASEIVALKPMITTMTYRPLIGVSTVTDPKEYTSYYEYDDFNRLKYIKDADGKLVKEYEYNYEN